MDELWHIFNPAAFGLREDRPFTTENEKGFVFHQDVFEDTLYKEITTQLTADLEQAGVPLTYTARILISSIALNLISISRITSQMHGQSLLHNKTEKFVAKIRKEKSEAKNNNSQSTVNTYNNNLTHSENAQDNATNNGQEVKTFDYSSRENGIEVHPIYNELYFKLQKTVIIQLEKLGLMPNQNMERQKWQIVEKLKKHILEVETPNGKYEKDLIVSSKKEI